MRGKGNAPAVTGALNETIEQQILAHLAEAGSIAGRVTKALGLSLRGPLAHRVAVLSAMEEALLRAALLVNRARQSMSLGQV